MFKFRGKQFVWFCLKVTIWWFLIILPLCHNCHSPPSWDKAPYQEIALYIYIYVYIWISQWNPQYIAIRSCRIDPIHGFSGTHESSIAGAVPHCQGGSGCQAARPGKNMKQVRMVLWMNIISYPIQSFHIISYHFCIYIYRTCLYIYTEYIHIYIYILRVYVYIYILFRGKQIYIYIYVMLNFHISMLLLYIDVRDDLFTCCVVTYDCVCAC